MRWTMNRGSSVLLNPGEEPEFSSRVGGAGQGT